MPEIVLRVGSGLFDYQQAQTYATIGELSFAQLCELYHICCFIHQRGRVGFKRYCLDGESLFAGGPLL